MANIKSFDWDNYMNTVSYNSVLKGMEVARKIIPTMFSPDQKQIYLKTDDCAYEVDDIETLNFKLNELLEDIKDEVKQMKWSCENLHLLQVDYLIIWTILENQSALPDDYKYPEHYLELAMNEFKPNK